MELNLNDVFAGDAFKLQSLTAAINKLPYTPGHVTRMRLFQDKPINTTSAVVEERHGVLSILPTGTRGAPGTTPKSAKREARSFTVPHIPHDAVITADSVQNVRAFGTESNLQTVQSVVNDTLTAMRQNHAITHEFQMIRALHGHVVDADLSTIFNWFTEFGVTEQTQDFAFTTGGTKVRQLCIAVARQIDEALGALAYNGIHGFCGKDFFDSLIDHADVRTAYERQQDGARFRDDPRKAGRVFSFGEIDFQEYRGRVGGIDFVDPAACRFFPKGVQGLFAHIMAPADMTETVNTMGRKVYARQEVLPMNRGVNIHTQSNPLIICYRPRVLVKGTMS